MTYIKSLRGQQWLLPPSIEDLIPEDHICFLVESLMDSSDYSQFDIRYAGAGRPAYHPRIILKLLVMGVLDRVRSSRSIARNARENVIYMYLAEKLCPDFRTISDFRKNNPALIKEVFKHTVTLAKQEGMLDLSHLSTDGTTVKANAANRNTLTEKELKFLLKFVENELDIWAEEDAKEDKIFGELRGSDQLPKKSKKKMQRAVKKYIKNFKSQGDTFREKLKEKLDQAHTELSEKNLKKVNLTDPESRFMKNKKGRLELSYNAQITVDKRGIILANDICQDQSDTYQLEPQINQTQENVQTLPEKVPWSFDNGYFEGANLKFLEDNDINGYIPPCESKTNNPYDKKHFKYDSEKDEYTCPKNQKLKFP